MPNIKPVIILIFVSWAQIPSANAISCAYLFSKELQFIEFANYEGILTVHGTNPDYANFNWPKSLNFGEWSEVTFASAITRSKDTTFRPFGFVLQERASHRVGTWPEDTMSGFSSNTSLEPQFKEYRNTFGNDSKKDLIDKSSPQHHNEMILKGVTEKDGPIQIVGLFLRVDWRGEPLFENKPPDTVRKMKSEIFEFARKFNLPIYLIRRPPHPFPNKNISIERIGGQDVIVWQKNNTRFELHPFNSSTIDPYKKITQKGFGPLRWERYEVTDKFHIAIAKAARLDSRVLRLAESYIKRYRGDQKHKNAAEFSLWMEQALNSN